MSWNRDALWNKAKLFFERAFQEERGSPLFGLWAAMGMELLVRSAIAHVSPLLLAEPDREQRNILHAFQAGAGSPKSITAIQSVLLCRALVPNFTDAELKSASALLNRRNDELHTGEAAFAAYPTQLWLEDFYRCCKVLAEFQEQTLEAAFGPEEARVADEVLAQRDEKLVSEVKGRIAAYARVFRDKDAETRSALQQEATERGEQLSHQGHHRVNCPACSCVATVQGQVHGGEQVQLVDRTVITRETVIPNKFGCDACGLKLSSYAALQIAGLAEHFTRRTEYTPEEYYGLVDPEDPDQVSRLLREQGEGHGFYEFNNE